MCRLSNGEEKWTKYLPMWLNFIICCRIKSLGNVTREPHKQITSTCGKQWKKFVGPEALPDTTFIMFTIFYNTCALFHRKSQIFLALDTVFVNSSRRKEHWAFTCVRKFQGYVWLYNVIHCFRFIQSMNSFLLTLARRFDAISTNNTLHLCI